MARSRLVFSVSLDPGVVERVDDVAKVAGQSRSVWLERAALAMLDGEPVRSPEAVAALREAWDSPRLREQFMESPVRSVSPVKRPAAKVVAGASRAHLPTCTCAVCKPPKS